MDDRITKQNFLSYCEQHYDGRQCASIEEFLADVNRVRYIKKLITRYIQTGELCERLILNHVVILTNVFGAEPTCKILLLKLWDQRQHIKPFLVLLSVLPTRLYGVGPHDEIETDLIDMNHEIVNALRKICPT